jgi:hypothetical protein
MVRYCKYDVTTGAILGVSMSEREPTLPVGFAFLSLADSDECDPRNHYIEDGEIADRIAVGETLELSPVVEATDLLVDIGLPVDISLLADGETVTGSLSPVVIGRAVDLEAVGKYKGAWSVSSRSLDDLRALKHEEINRLRDLAEFGGCMTHLNKRINTDPKSLSRINGATLLALMTKIAAQPFSIVWRMEDNTDEPLDADGMILVGQTVAFHTNAAFEKAKTLKALADAATTKAEIDAVQWDA